jgi:hypothetical protein
VRANNKNETSGLSLLYETKTKVLGDAIRMQVYFSYGVLQIHACVSSPYNLL